MNVEADMRELSTPLHITPTHHHLGFRLVLPCSTPYSGGGYGRRDWRVKPRRPEEADCCYIEVANCSFHASVSYFSVNQLLIPLSGIHEP